MVVESLRGMENHGDLFFLKWGDFGKLLNVSDVKFTFFSTHKEDLLVTHTHTHTHTHARAAQIATAKSQIVTIGKVR